MNTPEIGEYWFILRAGATCLSCVRVEDVTEKTVDLRVGEFNYHNERYKKDSIEFVEKTWGWK